MALQTVVSLLPHAYYLLRKFQPEVAFCQQGALRGIGLSPVFAGNVYHGVAYLRGPDALAAGEYDPFGEQTLYAHGIQSNLVPRTIVGVGFTWNLFDGLAREKRIRQSKIAQQTLALGQEKAKEDLSVGIDKLYTQLQKAQDNVRALNTTIELSEELVRIRKKSFAEGMATSTEVVDAETMLATVRVARLAAYYEYDVALMNLLAICGTPERFEKYFETTY